MNKVIEFIPFLSDGGAETLVRNYSLILQKKGYIPIVVVLFSKNSSANEKIMNRNNIEIKNIYNNWNPFIRFFHKILGRYYVGYKMKKILKSCDYPAIHIHQSLLYTLEPISKFLKKHNVKLFYTCHSLPKVYFSGKNKKEYFAAKKLIQNNNLLIIALHNNMKKEINLLFNIDNCIVLKNGINLPLYKNLSETKEEIRLSLGVNNNSFVIGHIGRFVDVKNHKFLLEVFKEVCVRNKDSVLLLVGSGELESDILKMAEQFGIKNNLLILNNRTDINRILKSIDVFVFPSKYEGLPLSLVEAQASGIRCVVSDRISNEAILNNNCYVLSLDDDKKIWVDTIFGLNNKIAMHTNKIEDFDLNKVVEKLINLYFS